MSEDKLTVDELQALVVQARSEAKSWSDQANHLEKRWVRAMLDSAGIVFGETRIRARNWPDEIEWTATDAAVLRDRLGLGLVSDQVDGPIFTIEWDLA